MIKVVQMFGRFQQAQGGFSSLPNWARLIVFVFALPALAIAGLSIALLAVSILALLLLTVPVYRLLKAVTAIGTRPDAGQSLWEPSPVDFVVESPLVDPTPIPTGRRQIEVKIVQ